ncbi:coatomer epsilon subunit-domain-containing protein [Piptocephalis cylindrospora]|uniref:Coatomer subunit epsilon n=1 Tax=Piptocephalis cylindrospora TaxID=1907219 RepID=A0A4P9Y263_9FUNG|nr:coatomer epsilon subunit-domain-containing protein [Piptocephalis cylindrospora]|eukprot:RKP12141.1 coatomer epsilon subunit-domain-containing protein [Piptocephalis cylindrospora]
MDSSNSELLDLLYLGAYDTVVAQASKVIPDLDSDDDPAVRRLLLIRAYAAKKQWDKVEEEYTRSREQGTDTASVVASAETTLPSPPRTYEAFVLASLLGAEGRWAEALKVVSQAEQNLECAVLKVQIHLRMHRADLADKAIKAMRDWAEDRVPFQLVAAYKDVYQSGDSHQEAFFAFEEIYASNATPSALNGQIVANLCLHRLPEAQALVNEANANNTSDPNILANAVATARLAGSKNSQEQADRYLRQLEQLAPNHPLLQRTKEMSDAFDAVAAKYLPISS